MGEDWQECVWQISAHPKDFKLKLVEQGDQLIELNHKSGNKKENGEEGTHKYKLRNKAKLGVL